MTYARRWQTLLRIAGKAGHEAVNRAAAAAVGEVGTIRGASRRALEHKGISARAMQGAENGGESHVLSYHS